MKILLFAKGADRPHQAGHYVHANLRAPLVKAGHEILDVDFDRYRTRDDKVLMGKYLKDLVQQERPDLFFHVIVEDELDPNLAKFIRDETSTTSLVFFSDDDWRMSHSLEWVNYYNVALTTCSDAYDRYRQLGYQHVFLTPYACNPDWYYPVAATKMYDVTFVGQAYRGRPELLSWLKRQGVKLRVWGSGWEEYPELRDIAGGFLPHERMLEVFAQSRIVLGLSWCSADEKIPQIKGRTFEYPACQAFQLASFDKNLSQYYHIDKEIVMFRDRNDLLGKIQYFLEHEDQRDSIAEAGYRRTIRDHTWERRFEGLFQDLTRFNLSQKRPLVWPGGQKKIAGTLERQVDQPRVSIICYVFNGETYIQELIESVQAQTYQDFEFLILDDGSTDRTKRIIEQYSDDPHIRYVYQQNIGQGKNFHLLINRCLELTTGEFVCAVGSDDVLLPEKLARQIAAFDQDPRLDVVFSDGFHINAVGQTLSSDFRFSEAQTFTPNNLLRTLFHKNIIAHPTVMLRRAAIDRMGGFEGGFATDYQFWLKSASYLNFKYIDEKLLKYRIHSEGASTGNGNQTVSETVRLLWEHRKRCTILDLYPEIQDSPDPTTALYQAYVRFGNSMLTANIPVLPLAIQEYQRALQHCPHGIEARNNLGVCLWLGGEQDQSRTVFEPLKPLKHRFPIIANNLEVIEAVKTGFVDPNNGLQLFTSFQEELYEPSRDILQVHGSSRDIGHSSPHKGQTMSDQPLVSVIVPTLNRQEFLVKAIKSILDQTYRAFEIIVVNDGGEDVGEMLANVDVGNRIHYLRLPINHERSYARNMGIRIARGKYVAYLDDDDRFLPDHLEALVTFLEQSDYEVAYTDAYRVVHEHHHGRYVEIHRDVPYSFDFSRDNLLRENYIPILSIMHSRDVLERTGFFDESLNTHEDWDLWIRMSEYAPFGHLKKVTAEFSWRMDGSTTTSSRQEDFIATKNRIHERYGVGAVPESPPDAVSPKDQGGSPQGTGSIFTCSIIIPVFNRVELTQQCLTHLAQVTSDPSFEVIIVDNASSDETPEFLRTLEGDIQVIRNEENRGFAKACNQGAALAKGKYLVFLNNDTIPQSGWLTALVEEVESHEQVGVVGSKLLYPNNTIQHAGVVISRKYGTPYHFLSGVQHDHSMVNERKEYQAVTAACMLVRKEIFSQVGGFDESYINGFEDVDFCLKVRELSNIIVYQPKSCLYHLESQTAGRKEKDAENAQRFWERWSHRWIEDEDIQAWKIDCAAQTSLNDTGTSFVLAPLKEQEEKAQWETLVQVQTLLFGSSKTRLTEMSNGEQIRTFIQDCQSWPLDLGALEWGGRVCESLGCHEEAEQFWERLLSVADHPHARIGLARSAIIRQQFSEAQAHLDVLDRKFSPKAERWSLQGVLCMQTEELVKAKEAFQKAFALEPDHKKSRLGFGLACLGLGAFQEAWDAFRGVAESYPDDSEALNGVIQAGTALEYWPQLGEILERYLIRNPADCERRFALASVKYRMGDLPQARQQFDRLKLLQPHFEGLDQLGALLKSASTSPSLVAAQ